MDFMATENPQYLILDLGSQHIKAGYNGEGYPRFILPSVVGYRESPDDPFQRPLVAYDALYAENVRLVYPFQEKTVTEKSTFEWDWEAAKDLISALISKLSINPPDYYVVYIEPRHSSPKNKDLFIKLLEEKYFFKKVFVYKQQHLIMTELSKTSALVLELGHSISCVVAYYKGFEIEPATRFFGIAGKLIADEFAEVLKAQLKADVSTYELVRLIDIQYYMAWDYEVDKKAYERGQIKKIEEILPLSRRNIVIGDERFRLPESLFKPEYAKQEVEGFASILRDAIMECPLDTRPEILENVILSGGLSKLRGLEERIKRELQKLFPNLNINIIAHERREATAWIAADNLCREGLPELRIPDRPVIGFKIPEIVNQFYTEALNSEKAKLWLATIILVERTLRSIIDDVNERINKTLETGLSPLNFLMLLHDQGFITTETYKWGIKLNLLKTTDSKVLLSKATKIDATETLDFLQIILEDLYTVKSKFDR